jgi:hypothetical protein
MPSSASRNREVLADRGQKRLLYEFSFVAFPQYEGATARLEEAK